MSIHAFLDLEPKDRLLTVIEAAELAGVDPGTIRNWISKGRLTAEQGLHYLGPTGFHPDGRRRHPPCRVWHNAFVAWVNSGLTSSADSTK